MGELENLRRENQKLKQDLDYYKEQALIWKNIAENERNKNNLELRLMEE